MFLNLRSFNGVTFETLKSHYAICLEEAWLSIRLLGYCNRMLLNKYQGCSFCTFDSIWRIHRVLRWTPLFPVGLITEVISKAKRSRSWYTDASWVIPSAMIYASTWVHSLNIGISPYCQLQGMLNNFSSVYYKYRLLVGGVLQLTICSRFFSICS